MQVKAHPIVTFMPTIFLPSSEDVTMFYYWLLGADDSPLTSVVTMNTPNDDVIMQALHDVGLLNWTLHMEKSVWNLAEAFRLCIHGDVRPGDTAHLQTALQDAWRDKQGYDTVSVKVFTTESYFTHTRYGDYLTGALGSARQFCRKPGFFDNME